MAHPPRPKDATAIAALPHIVSVHPYEGDWYNNATFALPLLGALGTTIAWLVAGGEELLGISLFLLAITGLMLPLVFFTWRRTPTVIVLRRAGIDALHQGRRLQSLAWPDVQALRRVDTMGNVRWYVSGPDGVHLTLEGEIADLDLLLAHARRLAGLPQDGTPVA